MTPKELAAIRARHERRENLGDANPSSAARQRHRNRGLLLAEIDRLTAHTLKAKDELDALQDELDYAGMDRARDALKPEEKP